MTAPNGAPSAPTAYTAQDIADAVYEWLSTTYRPVDVSASREPDPEHPRVFAEGPDGALYRITVERAQ